MLIIGRIDKGFPLLPWGFGVDVTGDFRKHSPVERFGNHLPIECVNIKIKLVIQQFAVGNLPGHGVINRDSITGSVMDAFAAEFCFQFVRSIVVNQIALNNCLTISIFEHRLPENLGSL